VVGDWSGSGQSTVGLYAAGTGMFFLRNSNAGGAADETFGYGPSGAGWMPVMGDWSGPGGTPSATNATGANAAATPSDQLAATTVDTQPSVTSIDSSGSAPSSAAVSAAVAQDAGLSAARVAAAKGLAVDRIDLSAVAADAATPQPAAGDLEVLASSISLRPLAAAGR
jgi:hypothetical protein